MAVLSRTGSLIVSFFAFLFLAPTLTLAATRTWDGGGVADTNWSTCANWSDDTCPVQADAVVFSNTSDNNSTVDQNWVDTSNGGNDNVTSISINSGYDGTITMAAPLQTTSTFTQSAGFFTAANKVLDVDSTFTLNTGADFTASSDTTTFAAFTISGGTFNANGGTVTFDGISNFTLSCNNITFNFVRLYHGSVQPGGAGGNTRTVSSNCSLPLGNSPTVPSRVTLSGTLSGTGTYSTDSNFRLNAGAVLSGFTGLSTDGVFYQGIDIDLTNYTSVTSNTVNITSGSVIAPSGTYTVRLGFNHTGGTFSHNNGTISLTDVDQTITGSSTFYNLTKTGTTTARTLTFPASATQTIEGTLTLKGVSGGLLSLRSSSTGTKWIINPQSTRSIQYVDVKDSNNTNSTAILVGPESTNSENNTNWTFDTAGPTTTELIYPTGFFKDEVKPTLKFKKTTDALTTIGSYSVFLDDDKDRRFSTTGIPASGNGTADYIWKDDSTVNVRFINEQDATSTNDEIWVYFKGLDSGTLTQGKHSWKALAYDNFGNSTESSSDFYLDETAPIISELSLAEISLVSSGEEYRLPSTNRTPSFSGKATDLYVGSERTNSDNSQDTFSKVSSGPDKIVLIIKKLKAGFSVNDDNFEDHLSQEFTLSDIQNLSNQEKSTRFYITTPYPLEDGYYKVSLALKDQAGNIYTNPDFYLSLNSSNNLNTKIINKTTTPALSQEEKDRVAREGYGVKVKVVDSKNKPVGGTKVSIHSEVQTAYTGEDGIAQFNNVMPGEHRILISYDGYEGEQTVNLTDDNVAKYSFDIQVEKKSAWASKIYLIVGLILGAIVTAIYLSKKRK